MNNWLKLPKDDQVELFRQVGVKARLIPQAIEKDAWVTLVLRLIFKTQLSEYLILKGGTSLSKGYNLIHRFSEDIDLGIDREYLGIETDLSRGEIRKLRRACHTFVSTQFLDILNKQLLEYGIDEDLFEIIVENTKISDQDPETIKINYKSVFEDESYLPDRVLIEIGARSLIEPYKTIPLRSMIDEYYPETDISENDFFVNATTPQKTFLEKLVLLHEEFQKPSGKIRYLRMSRHFYDIGQILNSDYGKSALKDGELFASIINHRKVYTPIKSTDYDMITLQSLNIIPPDEFIEKYRADYNVMQKSMIYGESLDFDELLEHIMKDLI
jgi:hypothetical protein